LPGGLAAGITGAVGVAILGVGLLLDVFVLKPARTHTPRMAIAVLVYFSGWLTTLEAFGARKWWTSMFPGPGMLLLVRLAGLGLLVFLLFGVGGLVLNRVSPVGQVAHDRVGMGHPDSSQVKATWPAIRWSAIVALFALSIPAGTWVSTYVTGALAAPGTVVANTVISAAVRGVGGGGR